MKTILVILAFLAAHSARTQDMYLASTIPAALTENAHTVVRWHETTFSVRSAGEATQRIHSVVTILDELGDEHAKTIVGYDKLSKVTELTGVLYDGNGNVIKKLKKSDIDDFSTYADYNLFDDQRYKSAKFPKQPSYPYTVEFVIETTERNLMFYPTWVPQSSEHQSVEQAVFKVTMPKGLALRYKELNMPGTVALSAAEDGGQHYVWKLLNRPAVEAEPFAPPGRERQPAVYTAPTEFEVQGYRGNLKNWADISRFYYTLNQGRDQIPDDLRQRVAALTADEKTTIGKVQRIYRFLQEQTRYVSVQLGIGGWQTIEAQKVAISKYGDCKALTNYTKALLNAVGVTAYPALVRAGNGQPDVLVDFPSFHFNHVLLCVPTEQDTLFLECTSGHDPAGYVGDFTGNRHVLLIMPEGGRLVRTPTYRATDNVQQRRISIKLTEQGDATADVRTYCTNLQRDNYVQPLYGLSRDEQRSWLLKRITIPAFDLESYSIREEPGRIPAVTETLSLTVRKWATPSGTRLFVPLNLLSILGPVAPATQPRQSAVHLGASYNFEDSDTITYQIPKEFTPEFRLEPLTIESKFGKYSAHATVEGDKLVYIRRVSMHSGRFPATDYSEWVAFRRQVAKADRVQMVFIKR